jgi:hypothetical protein
VTESAAVLVGASISAIVAMIVVGLQHQLERSRRAKEARAERLARFMAASHAIVLGLGDAAQAPKAEKKALLTRLETDQRDRINQAFAELRLLEKQPVITAATNLRGELVKLTKLAKTDVWSDEDWPNQRALLETRVTDYVTVGRKALRSKALPSTGPSTDSQ